ncbi:hypothetical protein PGT21_034412 [Puccinia graminis f. sp. tritici]|uniref:Uncharacterized protein n=1 Tax=Puccinia graminis f. sp. tritici TaxID=56615 RepID=A0A5B0MGU1_PUCGR|nr:hypothetical protein PGT21_034412 [Puccinia graminis f. sp. tritici]
MVLLKMDRPADGQEHEPERFEYPDCDSNSDPADHIPPNPRGSPAPLILSSTRRRHDLSMCDLLECCHIPP